jgi:lysophospholipid acyltransferase (LPLAT)-like uncharacterized protein
MNIKKRLVKNFLIQKILAFIAAIYIHVVAVTSNIKFINNSIPEQYWKNDRPFILAFWHSQLMMISFSWKNKKKLNIIASGHSDGRFGAYIGKYFKLNNIPTYDKNKNISLRPIFKLLQQKDYIGIAPDGPRGPKEKISEGIIKIAKKSRIPIIPIGFWSSKNFQLKSWDSFLISLPFSKCSFVWGAAMEIPENLTDQEIINFQNKLEDNINKCITMAKRNC